MKCQVEDCSNEATAVVDESINLCDGHLFDYIESPVQGSLYRFFDRRRMAGYEAIFKMSDLPKEKILDVIRSIKERSPERYPPTRHLIYQEGRRIEGFPGSQDTLKEYLDRLIQDRKLTRKSEKYRDSGVVQFQTKYALFEDSQEHKDW